MKINSGESLMNKSLKKLLNFKLNILFILIIFSISLVSAPLSSTCPATFGTPGESDYTVYTYFPGFECILKYMDIGSGSSVNRFEYNSRGDLIKETYADDPEYNNVDYAYAAGSSIRSIKKNNIKTIFIYCTGTSDCPVGFLHQEYIEDSGTTISFTDYTYDSENRTVKISASSKEEKFEYDSSGNLVQYNVSEYIEDQWVSSWIKYGYDSEGNIISEEDSTGLVINYGYESVDYNCTELLCTDFVCVPGSECYTFYDCSSGTCSPYECSDYTFINATCNYTRLINRTINEYIVKVNYDSEGNILNYESAFGTFAPSEIYDPLTGFLMHDQYFNFVYNSEGSISQISLKGEESYTADYTLHSDSIIDKISFSDGISEEHTYDPLGRLIKVAFSGFAESERGPVFASFLPMLKSFITGFVTSITGNAISSSEDLNYYGVSGDIESSFSSEDISKLKSNWESKNGKITDLEKETCKVESIDEESYVTNKGEYIPNYCLSDYRLQEYSCSGSSLSSKSVDCEYGCSGYRCLNSTEGIPKNDTSGICKDYDANSSIGEEFANSLFISSYVSFEGVNYTDSCYNSSSVIENYCGTSSFFSAIFGGDLIAKYAIKECVYGCEAGACRSSPANESCFNNIQDIGELGIDCEGVCTLNCCLNGFLDSNLGETGIDCGGKCAACEIENETFELPPISPIKPGKV
jgi:hypothetical protein